MPHIPIHPSARKRHRQSVKREQRNHAIKARVRTTIKHANEAITHGDKTQAEQRLREATRLLYRAAGKGTLHPNTVRRKVSQLSRRFHMRYAKASD